jgi:hypothetical protein
VLGGLVRPAWYVAIVADGSEDTSAAGVAQGAVSSLDSADPPAANLPAPDPTPAPVAAADATVEVPAPAAEVPAVSEAKTVSDEKPVTDGQPDPDAKPKRLSRKDILDRLRLNSSGLVEEIHSIALRQNQAEDQRESRLDGKAQGLLGTAGLSLTVAFTFGGILLKNPEYLKPLGWTLGAAVVALYALALLFGLVASIEAIRALFVSNSYAALSDDDVFNEERLIAADKEALKAAKAAAKAEGKETPNAAARTEGDKAAQSFLRRSLIVQHWTIYRQHYDTHERKASIIKCGQYFFIAFLVTLLLIGAAVSAAAFVRFRKSLDVDPTLPPEPSISAVDS